MKNSDLQNNYYDDEIDLREVFNTLIDQKKIIIIITLIFGVIAAGYTYLQKPTYSGSISFNKPDIITTSGAQVERLKVTLDSDLALLAAGLKINNNKHDSLLIISTTRKSIEKAEIVLNKVTDFLLETKNKEIKDLTQTLDIELKRLELLDKTLPASSGIEELISSIRMRIQKASYFEVVKKLQINPVKQRTTLIILLSSMVGFMLSILVVFARQTMFQERK